MDLAMSILYDKGFAYEKAVYYELYKNRKIEIGSCASADIHIPTLKESIEVIWKGSEGSISFRNGFAKYSIPIVQNQFIPVDCGEQLIFFFKEKKAEFVDIEIPDNGEIIIGRDRVDGRAHVLIDASFISGEHLRIYKKNGCVYFSDLKSKNGVYLNGKKTDNGELHTGDVLTIYTVRMYLRNNSLIIENVGGSYRLINMSSLDYRKEAKKKPGQKNILFHTRSPRLFTPTEARVINIDKPPHIGAAPKINWLSVLVAPVISIALMLLFVLSMGLSPLMMIMSGISSLVAMIVAIITYLQQKKQHTGGSEQINIQYRNYLERVSDELSNAAQRQLIEMQRSNPIPEKCLEIASIRDAQLWSRLPEDDDFMFVSLGTGSVDAAITANYQQSRFALTENPLEMEALELVEKSRIIPNAPILCDATDGNWIGVYGERNSTLQLMRNIITALATTHSYGDLKIVILCHEKELKEWEWARWLPHCSNTPRTHRYIFASSSDATSTMDELAEEFSSRSAQKEGFPYGNQRVHKNIPHYLFIVTNPEVIGQHAISHYLKPDANVGCTTIFISDRINMLPKECNSFIEVKNGQGVVFEKTNAQQKRDFLLQPFSREDVDRFARALASVYTDVRDDSNRLPPKITFLEGYKVAKPNELMLEKRWQSAKTFNSLAVPIAALPNGENFHFDIHEKESAHGVMGVVAGMSGSGKTEMVMSWLLSMAVNYSPEDVSFVIIDFKGTGLLAPFKNLPHLAGGISNLDVKTKSGDIDPARIERNLIAIKSEKQHRMELLNKYSPSGMKYEINDLNRDYARGKVGEHLPVLLIVIDEFAEFKREFPDFAGEIDSLLRTGRALGMFVVLATQTPSGVVSRESENNVRFRWCLRVANSAASKEMLGTSDAARITAPGRAYVKVGDGLYEQVQSFWSGAPYNPDREKDCGVIPISCVDTCGRRYYCENIKRSSDYENTETEIGAVVQYIKNYCINNSIPNAEKIWTDALAEKISLFELLNQGFNGQTWPKTKTTSPIVALVDDPANQRKIPLKMDFANDGHTLIYGAPVTGKTTFLKTMIMSMAMTRKPDDISIYVMDFGGWSLNTMRDLPHVAEIVNDNESERLTKLTQLIIDILEKRKTEFLSASVGNITAYRELSAGVERSKTPDVILVVDNFGSVLKNHPELDEFFVSLVSMGANYGIYLVATVTGGANAVPYKIAQNIKNKIALQMVDQSDYREIVGRTSMQLPQILGRGYVKGNPPLMFQTALPAPGKDDNAIVENIRKISSAMHLCWKGTLPAKIPVMPEKIEYGSIQTKNLCLGLSKQKVESVCFDPNLQHFLMISGMVQSGKSNMLHVLALQIKERLGGSIYVFDIKGNGTSGIKAIADKYLCEIEHINGAIEELYSEAKRRFSQKRENPGRVFEAITIVIDDYSQFYKEVSTEMADKLAKIVCRSTGLGVYLLIASDAYGLASWVNQGDSLAEALTKAKYSIMLGGCMNDHGSIPVNVPYSQKSIKVDETEGFYISDGKPTRFKAMCAKEDAK